MEASTEVVGSDEDVVSSLAPIPESVLGGNELHCRCNERPSVTNRREAINGAEVAGDVDGYEEKVSFVWVKCPDVARQQCPVNGHLRCKQMIATPLSREPIGVVFRWQIVNKNLQIPQYPCNDCENNPSAI